jgi:hypothetical protein
MNFSHWLILFIDPQIELLTGGMSQFDSGADIFGWHFKQHGIDRNRGIIFNFSLIALVKMEFEFMLLDAPHIGIFDIIEIAV